jgi:hypothetical protein
VLLTDYSLYLQEKPQGHTEPQLGFERASVSKVTGPNPHVGYMSVRHEVAIRVGPLLGPLDPS